MLSREFKEMGKENVNFVYFEFSERVMARYREFGCVLCVDCKRVANFESDPRRYASSSMVPFRPDPALRSNLRFERELRLYASISADVNSSRWTARTC